MDNTSEVLGQVRRTFRAKRSNIIAGAILGLGLLVGGIALAVFIIQSPDRKPDIELSDKIAKYVIAGLMGLGAPLGGACLLWWVKNLATHRVELCENGFSYFYGGVMELCSWSETAKIQEVFTEEQMKVLKVPGAAIKNIDRSFIVHRQDGKTFRFTVNSIDSIPFLAQELEQAASKHGIEWEEIQQ